MPPVVMGAMGPQQLQAGSTQQFFVCRAAHPVRCCSIVVWNESECLLRNETRGVSLFCYCACSLNNKCSKLQ
jgi:hypothetical protein